jgi:hypothetical protein
MAVHAQSVPRRTHTWWHIWLATGVIAAGLVTTWAAGIVTSDTEVGTIAASEPLVGEPGGSSVSLYDGAVEVVSPLTIGFQGTWGTLSDDTKMFEVTLTAPDLTTGSYEGVVYALNEPEGWEWLQVQFLVFAGACPAVSFAATPVTAGVLYVEREDSKVTLPGLAGGGTYCIGVRGFDKDKAKDPATSFIRRPSASAIPVMPQFAATVRRVTG